MFDSSAQRHLLTMKNKGILAHKEIGSHIEVYHIKLSDKPGQNVVAIKHGKGPATLIETLTIGKVPGKENEIMVELVKAAS